MGLGSTTKKLQKVASVAEESYKRMNELREQLAQVRQEVEDTSEQVDQIEYDLAEQRALLEALAEKEGIDVDSVIADANIEAVEPSDEETAADGDTTADTPQQSQSAGNATQQQQ